MTTTPLVEVANYIITRSKINFIIILELEKIADE